MKSVLILVFSNLRHDARVMRQVHWLRKNFAVTAVCFDADPIPGVTFVKVSQTKLTPVRKALLASALLLRRYPTAYRLFHNYQHLETSLTGPFDLIVANDIDTLPLAFRLSQGAPVIFDAHEYAPRHFENSLVWRTFFQPFYIHLCRQNIPKVSAMLTVGKGLAEEYHRNFAVRPTIITNATRYSPIEPSPLREGAIRLVYHGIANPSRQLELLIDMMAYLDERFHLDLFLMISDFASSRTRQYINNFKMRAEAHPRIRIRQPVKSDQIVATINAYDMGVFLLPPVNFNYTHTLPNKLFDFIQARLGIAIGPTPEMASVVNSYRNGVVATDFHPKSLAAKLNALTADDVARFKENSAIAANDLNAEKNEVIFNEVVNGVLR